jgi:hypothetical protein
MPIGRIRQFMAYSREGPTFQADLRGLLFQDGICGPINETMAQRATVWGAQILEVDPGADLEWENDPATGWTLKAIPARAEVDMGRLLVFDPDAPPAELGHDFLAFLKLYDLRDGTRRKGKGA